MNFTFKNFLSAACLILAILGLNACVKDRNPGYTDFSNLAPTVSIVEGGLAKFNSQTLLFPGSDLSDTISFRINYGATTVAPRDITVTLAYDAAALAAYSNYVKFPDSIYAPFPTKVVIKKGQSYSELVKLVVYPNKIDPSANYMLPISIVDAEGIVIASNFKTIYYHIIGNPLAGTYNLIGTRYAYVGSITWAGFPTPIPPPASTLNLTLAFPTKVAAAIDGQTIGIDFSNLGGNGYQYLVTADASFSSVSVAYNTAVLSGDVIKYSIIKDYSFIGAGTAASPKPTFRIITHYNNNGSGTGNDRILDELFTHL